VSGHGLKNLIEALYRGAKKLAPISAIAEEKSPFDPTLNLYK
jgi:hypothetical protein